MKINYEIDNSTEKLIGKIENFQCTYGDYPAKVMRPITSFHGEPVRSDYYVTSDGHVFNKKSGKFLEPQKRGGHYSVRISFMVNGHPVQRGYLAISELVLTAFAEPPSDGRFTRITYLDSDPMNNSLSNLAYSIPKKLRPKPKKEVAPLPFKIDERPPKHGKHSPYGFGYGRDMDEEELAKPLTSYQGRALRDGYYVTNRGRVYSALCNQFLKPQRYQNGGLYVRIRTLDGKRINVAPEIAVVHGWIYDEFLNEKVGKLLNTVNHFDGNRSNNDLRNLETTNSQYNSLHYHHELKPKRATSERSTTN